MSKLLVASRKESHRKIGVKRVRIRMSESNVPSMISQDARAEGVDQEVESKGKHDRSGTNAFV